ncbi:MAG: MoaD/ThiS family protein [Nitrosarchaeum sp.]|nr:MoaD/ThiS family protein [Nitrosarchaeum sp.]MBP0119638.1 MoaD/ThiS family protein [Nitrosarchaeum sp.]MBP0134317.1 MoaD/ThiS family protein [Nitrosarchaeum sp.]
MILVKFVGGAKKSFISDQVQIDKSDISLQDLIDLILQLKPENTPNLDVENILIAINGIDSSAIDGKSTIIKNNDLVSIIPIIHGGSSKRLVFDISNKLIQAIEFKGEKDMDVKYIDVLRKQFPKVKLQAISSNFILNKSHLRKIISLSVNSDKNNTLLSNKFEIDILMRFAISSQISFAINSAGIKSKQNFILIALGSKKNLDKLYDELKYQSVNVFEINNTLFIKKYFNITNKQLDTILSNDPLVDLLVEKAAILF